MLAYKIIFIHYYYFIFRTNVFVVFCWKSVCFVWINNCRRCLQLCSFGEDYFLYIELKMKMYILKLILRKKAEITSFIFQNHIDKYLVIDSKGLELKFLYVGLLYVFVYFSYKIYNRINVGFYWFSFYKKKNYKCVKINRNMNRGTSSHVLVLF